ncbi:alpha/beta hydrolase [Gluconobacter cerinus]|uniref:alpha/beta hydrolase n=1 Tax=Gluconobacter cerinus TaxID=38307 RepID=UPI003AB91173
MIPVFLRSFALLAVVVLGTGLSEAATERDLEAPGPLGPLSGTYLDAGKTAPVLLLVPGSGPTDRNGDSASGLKPGTLKLLAEGLADRGISTVRVDKRGMFGSARAVANGNHVTIQDYVTDVQNWISVIRKETGTRCVWLGGHSEGALVVLAASQHSQGVCGLILLSGQGRPMGELIRAQLHANPRAQTVLPQIDSTIDALEAGHRVDPRTLHPGLQALFNADVQGYLIDVMRYDPAALLRAYHGPVLLVQGGKDHQISPTEDLPLLQAADPRATTVYLPSASHFLTDMPGVDSKTMTGAGLPSFGPLDPDLVPHVAEFVLGH